MSYGYHACTAGKGKQVVKGELEKINFPSISVAEGIKSVGKVLG